MYLKLISEWVRSWYRWVGGGMAGENDKFLQHLLTSLTYYLVYLHREAQWTNLDQKCAIFIAILTCQRQNFLQYKIALSDQNQLIVIRRCVDDVIYDVHNCEVKCRGILPFFCFGFWIAKQNDYVCIVYNGKLIFCRLCRD